MSDWEDEYDEDGVAIETPPPKLCQTRHDLPLHDQYQSKTAFHSTYNFGGPRVDRASRSHRGFQHSGRDDGGSRAWEGGSLMFRDRSDSGRRPTVTLTVDSAKVGRVIGKFPKHKRVVVN